MVQVKSNVKSLSPQRHWSLDCSISSIKRIDLFHIRLLGKNFWLHMLPMIATIPVDSIYAALMLVSSLDKLSPAKGNRTMINVIKYTCVYLQCHVSMAVVKRVHRWGISICVMLILLSKSDNMVKYSFILVQPMCKKKLIINNDDLS